MTANVFSWKKLFYFCLGLFLASAFCMKWMEPDFISKGKAFSIMDLELYLNKEQLTALFAGLDDKTRTIVDYHLHFDFFFMAGVFPGIASICMLVREKVNQNLIKKTLFVLAVLQLLAWSFDVYENMHLIKWMKNPATIDRLDLYHTLVKSKFVIAFAGLICAAGAFIFFRKIQKI
jgi:hypothetical protein